MNELGKVRVILDRLIKMEQAELEKIESTPIIRGMQSYTLERKYLTAGKIQALCDAYVIVGKVMLGEKID